jgi:kinesin family protein 5
LGTLRFGSRARNIKNTPKVNKEYTVPELKKLLGKAEEKIDGLEA